MVIAVMGRSVRCFPQFAPNVARVPKYLSNLVKTDRFIAVIATEKSDPTDK